MDNQAKIDLYNFQKDQIYKDIKYRIYLMANPNVRPDMNDVLYILNKINEIRDLNTEIEKITE